MKVMTGTTPVVCKMTNPTLFDDLAGYVAPSSVLAAFDYVDGLQSLSAATLQSDIRGIRLACEKIEEAAGSSFGFRRGSLRTV